MKENAIACAPLRDKQVEVVSNLLEGHDAFGVLPTGKGKSFSGLPPIFDHVSGVKKYCIVIVVPPLVAIMKDQVCYTLGAVKFSLLVLVQPVPHHLVAFTWWSCGFPTPHLCSPQPHPQHVLMCVGIWFVMLMSPDSVCALARVLYGVWLHKTNIHSLHTQACTHLNIYKQCVVVII